MTAAEAIAMLAKLPDATPVCFTIGDMLLEITGVEMVDALAEADGYSVTFDGAREDALRVAVVS